MFQIYFRLLAWLLFAVVSSISIRAAESLSPVSEQALDGAVVGLVSSKDGASVAVATETGLSVLGGEVFASVVQNVDGCFGCVAFHPQGQWMVAGDQQGRVRLWDVGSGQELESFGAQHTAPVVAVWFSPDGRLLASGSWDGTVMLWDVVSRNVVHRFAHEDEVYAVAFSPNGDFLVLGSWDRTVRVWTVDDGHAASVLKGHDAGITALRFSPDGRYLVSGDWAGDVQVWRADSLWESVKTLGGEARAMSLAVDLASRLLAAGYEDGRLLVWDLHTWQVVAALEGHSTGVTGLDFANTTGSLVSGGRDAKVAVWQTNAFDRPPPVAITYPPQTPFQVDEQSVEIVGMASDDDYSKWSGGLSGRYAGDQADFGVAGCAVSAYRGAVAGCQSHCGYCLGQCRTTSFV